MYTVMKEIHFCYGHRLLRYEGKCRHPHGHNGKVEIRMAADRLDPLGMVVDFEIIKRVVQTWIDRELDHKMLLNREDPLIQVFRDMNEPYFVMDANPTAENIARVIYDYAASQKLPVVSVTLWETPQSHATYGSRA